MTAAVESGGILRAVEVPRVTGYLLWNVCEKTTGRHHQRLVCLVVMTGGTGEKRCRKQTSVAAMV